MQVPSSKQQQCLGEGRSYPVKPLRPTHSGELLSFVLRLLSFICSLFFVCVFLSHPVKQIHPTLLITISIVITLLACTPTSCIHQKTNRNVHDMKKYHRNSHVSGTQWGLCCGSEMSLRSPFTREKNSQWGYICTYIYLYT